MKEKINNLIKEIRQDAEFNDDTELVAAGILESFELIALVSALEKAFSVKIPAGKMRPQFFNTVNDIANLMESLK